MLGYIAYGVVELIVMFGVIALLVLWGYALYCLCLGDVGLYVCDWCVCAVAFCWVMLCCYVSFGGYAIAMLQSIFWVDICVCVVLVVDRIDALMGG